MSANWIDAHDGVALGQMLRAGEIGASELLEAVLARIDERNPAVNAVVLRMDDFARQQAQAYRASEAASPLAGVPVLVKDLLADVAGFPTRSGCMATAQFKLPQHDAEIIRRYKAAGLVLAGKTATPELGLVPYTESRLYGITRNPWDMTRTPGGSSGGAAAAVAARMVPLAHGGDGGGSIRIPASNCGLFGLKPSRGRSPRSPGFVEIWQGIVTEHALTRSVRDSAAMLDIFCASHGDDAGAFYYTPSPPQGGFLRALEQTVPRLRIAFTLQPFTGGEVHAESRTAVEKTVSLLQSLGHVVEEARPPLASPEELGTVMQTIVTGSVAQYMRMWPRWAPSPLRSSDVEPMTWAVARMGELVSAGQLAWAREMALQQGVAMAQFHTQYDVLLTPAMNQPPALVGSLGLPPWQATLSKIFIGQLGMHWLLKALPLMQEGEQRLLHYMGWPIVANLTGQPAISVPLHWSAPSATAPAGLPVGVMFAGRLGNEASLLQLAQQLEQAQPWWHKMPPSCQ